MATNSTSTQALISQLLSRGVLTQNEADKFNKRAARAAEQAAKAEALNAVAGNIMSFIGDSTDYFTVKSTANSTGVLPAAEADRSTTLKAITQLVSQGQLVKVGLVGGEEKPVADVNAFQIRYRLPAVEAQEEATEEAAEETN